MTSATSTPSTSPLAKLRTLLEMIRFSHTIFALPFALAAAAMAWMSTTPPATPFRWLHLAGIVVCMIGARSAAMAFNRLADARIDAGNPRTAGRHIPAGLLSRASVSLFALGSGLLFLAGTLLFLPNWLPLALAVPVLGFLLAYTYTKRFTSMAHFWLGASLMLAPISAWIAIRGLVLLERPADILPAVVLGAAVLLWVAGFDIIYACQDFEYDRGAKLRSIPAALGLKGALRLAAVCHLGMIGMLALLPFVYPQLGFIYWAGIAAVAVLLVYEHALVRPDDLTRVNRAFFQVNAVVSVGLLGVVVLDLFL